jgi:hypothetical protein
VNHSTPWTWTDEICTLCAHRLAGPDANAQRRGQVSRQLKAELLALIGGKECADGDD